MRDFFIGVIGTMVIFLILGIGGTIEMYFQKKVLTFPKLYDIIKKKEREVTQWQFLEKLKEKF